VKPFTNESPLKQQRTTSQVAGAINDGWLEGGSFVSSILAGTLLGLLADNWLGTDPWLVVIGIIAGSYSGFVRVWRYSIKMEEDPRER
jgi:F0F1-type ATP synthase assembly protein I